MDTKDSYREVRYYRGKDLMTLRWHIGYYVHDGAPCICNQLGHEEYMTKKHVLLPTVGQQIGKKDKDRTDIFEDDIITVNGKYPKLVVWDDKTAGFGLINVNDIDTPWGDIQHPHDNWWSDRKLSIKVIGNRFDNPELLIKKEENNGRNVQNNI